MNIYDYSIEENEHINAIIELFNKKIYDITIETVVNRQGGKELKLLFVNKLNPEINADIRYDKSTRSYTKENNIRFNYKLIPNPPEATPYDCDIVDISAVIPHWEEYYEGYQEISRWDQLDSISEIIGVFIDVDKTNNLSKEEPFLIEKQLQIDTALKEAKKVIEEDEEIDQKDKALLIENIKTIRKSIPKSSEFDVMLSIYHLYAKAYNFMIPLGMRLLKMGAETVIKEVIKSSIKGLLP